MYVPPYNVDYHVNWAYQLRCKSWCVWNGLIYGRMMKFLNGRRPFLVGTSFHLVLIRAFCIRSDRGRNGTSCSTQHKGQLLIWYIFTGRNATSFQPCHCPVREEIRLRHSQRLQHANCPVTYLYPVAVISCLVRTQLIYMARHLESFCSR
jgi:hypothetical protein